MLFYSKTKTKFIFPACDNFLYTVILTSMVIRISNYINLIILTKLLHTLNKFTVKTTERKKRFSFM